MKYFLMLIFFSCLYLTPATALIFAQKNQDNLYLLENTTLWAHGRHGASKSRQHKSKSARKNTINWGRGGWGSGGYGAAGAYMHAYSGTENPAPLPAATPIPVIAAAPTSISPTTPAAALIDPNAPPADLAHVFQKIRKEKEDQESEKKDDDDTSNN